MRPFRHILIALLTFLVTYVVLMGFVSKFHYKGKPLAFVTNDYYTWKGGDTYQKFLEFGKEKKYDVVVVGSSRAYRGYSPFIFREDGERMFNLGSSAQSIHNTYYLVRNYLDSSNTGTLIIDVFAGAFRKAQLESSSDLIENIGNENAVRDIAWHTPDVRALNIYMLHRFTAKDAPYFVKKDYAGFGFSVKTDSLDKKHRKALPGFKQPTEATIEVDQEALRCFSAMLDHCKQHGIPVVVVYSPVSDFYSRVDHAEFIRQIKPILNSQHVPFYDYTNVIHLNTVYHFYDETHMNMAGVQIFNEQLLKDLHRDRILPMVTF